MHKSINAVLEGIRGRLEDKPKGEVQAEGGSKYDALVKKLKKRKDIKDPEALAAWIGRKKYGKSRFSKMGESADVPELLVFEDIEDVIAFVEGLEVLTEPEVTEEMDHKVMGAYRAANPHDAPKLYKNVKKAAKAYLDLLQGMTQKETEAQREFIFAARALERSIKDSYTDPSKAMASTMDLWHAIRSNASSATLLGKLKALVNSSELKLGASPVRVRK